MPNDLYSTFLLVILILLVIVIFISSIQRFEIAVLLIMLSPLLAAIFIPNNASADADAEVGLSSYVKNGIPLLMAFVSIVKYFQLWYLHRGKIPLYLGVLSIIITFAFISATYSLDPDITLIRSMKFLILFIFLIGFYFWIIKNGETHSFFNTLYVYALIFIAINLVAIVVLPDKVWWWVAPGRFEGVLSHPNDLGGGSALIYPILLWKYAKLKEGESKFVVICCFVIITMFLLLSGSRTSILLSGVAVGLWFLFGKKRVQVLVWLMLVSIGLVILLTFTPANLERGDQDLTTLTGRQDFWSGAITMVLEKPFTGYGFNVEGKIWEDPRFYDPKLTLWSGSSKTSLHNGYISIAVGLGLIGLFIWVILLFLPLFKFKMKYLSNDFNAALSIMSVLFLSNFVEASIGANTFMFWLSWVVVGIYTFSKLPVKEEKKERIEYGW